MNILVNILVLMNIFSHKFTSKKARSRYSSYLQSCNSDKTFISQIYIELSVVLIEKLDFFSALGDVKLIATLIMIMKPTNLSHIQSELQNDT